MAALSRDFRVGAYFSGYPRIKWKVRDQRVLVKKCVTTSTMWSKPMFPLVRSAVGASKLQENIRGTIVMYGDLAFKFLYWPSARVLGEENVRTRKCWKLQLRAPSRESSYSNVLLWVDKASGALMRMEGYDWNAQLIKRFEVVSAQKIEGRWFLKQMRVEQLQPGTNHVEARAYLEIKR